METNLIGSNTFWSQDYITGISAFCDYIKDDIAHLNKEVKFYENFIDQCCLPFLKHLQVLCEDNELLEHDTICDLLEDSKMKFNLEELKPLCLKPLQVGLKNANDINTDVESIMKTQYCMYAKDLKSVRDSSREYERMAAQQNTSCSSVIEPLQFPIELDPSLRFDTESELILFMKRIKEAMPPPRKNFMMYFSAEGRRSFDGKTILEAIKKKCSKLDTSLYNLHRLGQRLLDLRLIQEDSLTRRNRKFDQETFYYLSEHLGGPIDYDADSASLLSGWVKGLTINDNTGVHDLRNLETKFFEKCCKLEYSKYELEKIVYSYCKKYMTITKKENDELAARSSEVFAKMFTQRKAKKNPPIARGNSIMIKSGVVGYFTRDNCVSFCKWEINNAVPKCRKIMFGNDILDEDAVETIKLILTHIKKLEEEDVGKMKALESWKNGNVMNMNRVVNLKIEMMTIFHQQEENTSNLNTCNILISTNRYTIIDDWIGIIKLWLLELPDSLIPSKCCDAIAKQEEEKNHSWLTKVPLNNLAVLIEMCQHFQWLDNDVQTEIPLYHYFIRNMIGLRDLKKDMMILDPCIHLLLFENPSILQKAYKSKKETSENSKVTPETPIILIERDPPPTQPTKQEQQHDDFIPRPFKTIQSNSICNSPASSTPTSPISNNATKRRSGLIIEALELDDI